MGDIIIDSLSARELSARENTKLSTLNPRCSLSLRNIASILLNLLEVKKSVDGSNNASERGGRLQLSL